MNVFTTINLPLYLSEIADTLRPPVSNKIMFDGATLKVMIVGGPNKRDDFHIEDGEELFMQLKGPMELHVMNDGMRQKVSIDESKMFLLPHHLPHSPQRFSNTIGIVFERTRSSSELDTLRWYKPNTNDVLYEERFHCEDLGTQLKAIIERFFATSEYHNYFQAPAINAESSNRLNDIVEEIVYSTNLLQPFLITDKIEEAKVSLITNSNQTFTAIIFNLFDSEFKSDLIVGPLNSQCDYSYSGDVFVWQYSGSSSVSGVGNVDLNSGDCYLIPSDSGSLLSQITLRLNTPNAVVLLVYNKAKL